MRPSRPRAIFASVRLAFLLIPLLALATAAHADSVGVRQAPIVRGNPVPEAEVLGTVALLGSSGTEALEDVEPSTLPARLFCSGTLITATTVLTAGHCVQACPDGDCFCGDDGCQSYDPRYLLVGAGMTDIDSVWDTELVRVSNIVLHPDYTDFESLELPCDASYCTGLASNSDDVALLHLESPITSLRPVALYPEARILELAGNDTVALAQGYGLRLPPESQDLLTQNSYVALLNQGDSEIVRSTENELLTTREEKNVAVCYGDSGGPLYVVEGDTPMLAGVASRLRGDASECDGGGVYALAPYYSDWIRDNATGDLPSPYGGGGGCSASSAGAAHDEPLLVATMLLLLLVFRGRSVIACVPLCLLGAFGCGADGDASFCTEQYDPSGLFCAEDDERIDLQSAEERAQSEVPEDALLWLVSSSASGSLSPDGRDYDWSLTYYLPGASTPPDATLVVIQVHAAGAHRFDPYESETLCLPTESVPVLNSRHLVHDGIRFFEAQGETVSFADGGNMLIRQSHPCSSGAFYPNFLQYRGKHAFFDDEGTFRSVVEAFR